ncbi:mucin-5AC [Octopus bimaculoides]|uniref:UBC core domain-containing protein n=1 Tax=Octopus bimaculoides TaxID=37653 RepID=A0A0L8FSC7_OCTBM|nr:mucin-5AC [Octopus bimaculoides]|eukprot:XP_014787367.1 PREDICTED: mucin-5AC-like [Octopus bimaculoides]
MQSQYNMRSPAVKRLMKEAQELKDPTELFYAQPLDDNLFEWHFTIRGPIDTDFDGGIFHGRIVLPPDYPMKPPSIIILTPNGRFEVNKKICLSISGHHPESWQPSWSIRTALLAIIGFMPTHGAGAIGSLDYTAEERKVLSKKSLCWKCPVCGSVNNVLKSLTDASKKTSEEAKDLASKINFQSEKGNKSGSDKASTTATTSSNAGFTLTGSSTVAGAEGGGATAASAASAAATTSTPTWMMPPNMNYPSPLNMGSMPGMFPQSSPFFAPMTGQFPYHFRFPYPPTSMDPNVNSMPNCRMMPPFPNPFLPPMFPASYAFPQPGVTDNSNASVANVMPFSFPFMPGFPTVPAAVSATSASVTTSAPVSSPATVTSSSTSSTEASQSKQLTSSSASKPTFTNPSTTTTTATTNKSLLNATGGISQNSTDSASTQGLSDPAQPPSSQRVSDNASDNTSPTVETITAGRNDVDVVACPSPSSSSPLASATQSTTSPGTTLRHRTTTAATTETQPTSSSSSETSLSSTTTTTTTAPANTSNTNTSATTTSSPPQMETADIASPPNATTQRPSSRGTASFVLMMMLGAMILLLCLRRLYVSVDHLPYSDYMQ